MSEEDKFVDFATVRDMLESAQDRRGDLTYEQVAALQHAQWAASDNRNGYKTNPEVFETLKAALCEMDKLAQYPDLAAKIADGVFCATPGYSNQTQSHLHGQSRASDHHSVRSFQPLQSVQALPSVHAV